MRRFIKRTAISIFILVLIAEVGSRIFIDPLYFYSIDSYNIDLDNPTIMDVYRIQETESIDYLFIGSSRVPAVINPSLVMDRYKDKVAVVSARGYMTAGIHYQAIKNRMLKYPDFLEGAKVFLEYPGAPVYAGPFDYDNLRVYEPVLDQDKAMPHLLLPHLTFSSLRSFVSESGNSNMVKAKLVLQYVCSSYRTISFIKENFNKLEQKQLLRESEITLASEGGIRNDNLEFARQKAIEYREMQISRIEKTKPLMPQDLRNSSLSHLNELINAGGGELCLFTMPLNSIQAEVYETEKSIKNKEVFDDWLLSTGIETFQVPNFIYHDDDFPDTWHLSINRRDEFTRMLLDEIEREK